jgi:hypothetical protein
MEQASEGFQAVHDPRPRPVEVRLSVHGIDVTLAYGWEVVPVRQSPQEREHSAGLDQREATGAEEQHLRGIRPQPVPL